MTRATERQERYRLAVDLIGDAEAVVCEAEEALDGAAGYLAKDIAETELRRALALQDEVLATVAPAIEKRQREVREAGWEAVRSARGDPGSDWTAKHRRWMSPAVKSWIIRRLSRRAYMEGFPW